MFFCFFVCVFFQAEDGIGVLVRSRGLGDVYKRQGSAGEGEIDAIDETDARQIQRHRWGDVFEFKVLDCLLYTSDAADERSSVDLGGRRIIKKKKKCITGGMTRV